MRHNDFEFFWSQVLIAFLLMRMNRAAQRLRSIMGLSVMGLADDFGGPLYD
jgi:hypothetical protein